jgi:hypothetical protein
MKPSVEAWLRAAEKDLRLIDKVIDDEELVDHASFHPLQAVE